MGTPLTLLSTVDSGLIVLFKPSELSTGRSAPEWGLPRQEQRTPCPLAEHERARPTEPDPCMKKRVDRQGKEEQNSGKTHGAATAQGP